MIDRYEQHGLSGNPFACSPNFDLSLFVDRGLPAPPPPGSGAMIQIIGDRGVGKSTQLAHWRSHLPGVHHYVSVENRWQLPPLAPLVYADEVDRLPRVLRWRWLRALGAQQATVVVGTHVDIGATARRAGLEVQTHQIGLPSPLAFEQMVEQRFVAASLVDPGGSAARDALRLTADEIADIYRRSGGSLRSAEVVGHDVVARRVAAG